MGPTNVLTRWVLKPRLPELIQQLYLDLKGYEYLGAIAAVLVPLIFWTSESHVMHATLFCWLALMLCLYAYQWYLLRASGPELRHELVESWVPRYRLTIFTIALAWGALGPIMFSTLGLWQDIVLMLLLFSVLSTPISVYSNDYPATALSVLTITAPNLTAILADKDTWSTGTNIWVALAFLCGALLCLLTGYRLSESRRRAIKEQQELIEARTDIARIQTALRHEQEIDPRTRLGNRRWLERYLEEHYTSSNRPFYLVALGIDGFDDVTPTSGPHAADFVLQDLAARLNQPQQPHEISAKGEGDSFLILFDGLESGKGVEEAVNGLFRLLDQPFLWKGQSFRFTGSVGVAGWPEDGNTISDVLEKALLALREARHSPGNSLRVHDTDLQDKVVRQTSLRSELGGALERGEFEILFQPKVELASGRVAGAEALLRWRHPELGMVSPADFIPLAESTGYIVPLGNWVIREATRLLLDATLPPNFSVAVNVSIRQFADSSLLQTLKAAAKKLAGSDRTLDIEITESVMMDNPARVKRHVEAIADLGIGIALDDFGTGYSSLSCLTQFSIHVLKLDKSFIDSITSDSRQAKLVQAVIHGASMLGMQMVAEGVETEEQCLRLHEFGCALVQGYYFARPMPFEDLKHWMVGHEIQRTREDGLRLSSQPT